MAAEPRWFSVVVFYSSGISARYYFSQNIRFSLSTAVWLWIVCLYIYVYKLFVKALHKIILPVVWVWVARARWSLDVTVVRSENTYTLLELRSHLLFSLSLSLPLKYIHLSEKISKLGEKKCANLTKRKLEKALRIMKGQSISTFQPNK